MTTSSAWRKKPGVEMKATPRPSRSPYAMPLPYPARIEYSHRAVFGSVKLQSSSPVPGLSATMLRRSDVTVISLPST